MNILYNKLMSISTKILLFGLHFIFGFWTKNVDKVDSFVYNSVFTEHFFKKSLQNSTNCDDKIIKVYIIQLFMTKFI
jgi:hypothetical protein